MKKEVPTRALRTLMLVLLVALALSAPAGTPLASVTGTVTAKAATETSVKSLSKGKSYTLSGYAKVTSSDKSIATATKKSTKKYTITGVKKGTATLKCYDSDGKLVKKIYLIVTTSSSLKYDTSTVVLAKGKTKTVTATVQSGCTVKYSSSKTSVATVNSKGKITAKKTGTATISAKVYYKGTKIKTFKKTVAVVSYDTSAVTLTAGKSKTVAAKVPSGYAVSYSSSDKSVASVSSAGKITAKKAGTATITAKISYDGEVLKKLTKKITVTSASGTSSGSTASSVPALTYTFDTSAVTIAPGKTLSVKATVSDGYTVSYSSSDKSVATVSSSGVVTGVTEGAAAITVEISYNGTLKKTLTKKVTVAAPALTYTFDTSDATISPGKTLSVKASATTGYSVAYSSSDSSVATVSSSGVVTGVKGGTATINVKLSYNGTVKKTLAKSVTVRSYQLSSSSLSLDVNGTSTASLTCAPASGDTGDGDTFAWSSSDTSVATVDPDIETGSVKAVAAGTATITCRVNDTVALTCKVTVTKTFKNYANFCGSGTNYAGSNSIAGGRSGALVAWCEKASDAVTLEFSNDNLQIGDIEGPTAGYDQPNDMTGYCWYIYI
ncbi:MAG: Ig-like domain-containing protein, partial [Clostridiales bacterium]|nr:Ig-like domain-containing protein [Clostridiales bacterium]